MTKVWSLQNAKNQLSELVERAASDGAQVITRRGTEVAVVVSIEEYRRLAVRTGDLLTFFLESPLAGSQLELDRDGDPGREMEL